MSTIELGRVYQNYINGEWRSAKSGEQAASINPANRYEIVGYLPMSNIEDVEDAVNAAAQAQMNWEQLSGSVRGEYLYKTAAILESRANEIAETMTREMGKTFAEAKGETMRGVAILKYYAGEGMRKIGDVIPASDGEALMYTVRVPLGVIGIISPWNFPIAIPLWKIAPALIYGNSVVLKPAQETGVTAAKLMECFVEAGIPAGVINMVCGSGAIIGQALAEHPAVAGISFTGSNQVGKQVGLAAFSRGAKYQLEMGGKNPIIVASDADLDLAVEATISGGIRSTGQKCTATSRVIIEETIYEEFKSKLLQRMESLTLGNGLEEQTWLGPCASEKQMQTVLDYIHIGKEEGATVIFGGDRPVENKLADGFYVTPTVFENVTPNMRIFKEEIFGPVLALIKVSSLNEAIQLANDNEFGLSASIYTSNISHMMSFVRKIEAGMVRVNAETAGVELQAPFGGMKQSSSHSREQGQAAIEFYTAVKTVYVKA